MGILSRGEFGQTPGALLLTFGRESPDDLHGRLNEANDNLYNAIQFSFNASYSQLTQPQ